MRKVNRLFLYYCTIISIFLMISAPFPYQLVFLPVSLYLLFYSFKHIFRARSKTIEQNIKNPKSLKKVIAYVIIFLALLGVSLHNLTLKNSGLNTLKPSQVVDKTASASGLIVKSVYPTLVFISSSGPDGVSIYSDATTSAKVVTRAENGQGYRALSEHSQWLKINVNEVETGWVERQFVTFSQDNIASGSSKESSNSNIKNTQ